MKKDEGLKMAFEAAAIGQSSDAIESWSDEAVAQFMFSAKAAADNAAN
jgi:hypothetical protein